MSPTPPYDQLPVERSMLRDFLSLPPAARREIREKIRALSLSRGLTYQKEAGVTEAMNLVPLPAVMPASEARHIARLCREMIAVVKGIWTLYPSSPALKRVLPLAPREEEWISECRHHGRSVRQPIIYRMDADMPLAAPGAAGKARFFESNSVAVGGMLYGPVAESIVSDVTLRALYGRRGLPSLGRHFDTRLFVLGELVGHARALGRRGRTMAVLEDTRWETGITVMPSLVKFFSRIRLRAYLADPGELAVRRGEVCCRGRVIDVAYRNFEIRDLFDRGDADGGLLGLKELFKKNQVVSSLAGDLDHKSLLEVFTSEEFGPLFSRGRRERLARHIPWTRLIYGRHTADPEGRRVDLPQFARARRERLVLKPNRLCGGEGVALGPETTQRDWERILDRALREPGEWVVQEWVDNTVKLLPSRWGGGAYRALPQYTTYGFIAAPHGVGVVGRACVDRVVNIASGGALLPVFAC